MAKIDVKQLIESNFAEIDSDVQSKIETVFTNALNTQFRQNMELVDAVLIEHTGKPKQHGVLTTDWLKTTLIEASGAGKEEIETLKTTVSDLDTKLKAANKDGSGKERISQLEKELQDAKDLVNATKEKFEGEIIDWKGKYEGLQKEAKVATIKAEANKLSLRDDLDESIIDQLVGLAVEKIANYTSEKDSNGRTVYRNSEGQIMIDKSTLASLTTTDLLKSELSGVIKKDKQQSGAGTGGGKGGSKGGVLSVTATTQAEAYKQIENHLFTQGLAQGTEKFQEAFDKAWADNKIQNLPIS